jgi:hypothetical protein
MLFYLADRLVLAVTALFRALFWARDIILGLYYGPGYVPRDVARASRRTRERDANLKERFAAYGLVYDPTESMSGRRFY